MEYEIEEDEPVSTAVVRTVSAVKGWEPCSLEPLSDVVDPDALDAIFALRPDDTPRAGGRVSFTYCRCRVTVDGSEFLTVESFETTREPPVQSESGHRVAGSHSVGDTQPATDGLQQSCICFVCQQPIQSEELQRERGELVHSGCSTERRCGISLERRSRR
jgi:hypothetical protein